MQCKTRSLTLIVALVVAASCVMALNVGVTPVSASERLRPFTGTKDCTNFGVTGNFCTLSDISDPRLAKILNGRNLYYDQPNFFPLADGNPLLDSNVALDGGPGNKTRGRCTLDGATGIGLCTLEDGIGEFAGFRARIDVDCTSGAVCRIKGTYAFDDAE
jgi:hypothetical protein